MEHSVPLNSIYKYQKTNPIDGSVIPKYSNYVIENHHEFGKVYRRRVIEILDHWVESITTVDEHLKIENIKEDCKLLFTDEQYKKLLKRK